MKPFRDTLGAFATGVTVVTARAPDGEQVGITANSFNAVSLDPPLVLVSFARSLRSLPALLEAPAFAINCCATTIVISPSNSPDPARRNGTASTPRRASPARRCSATAWRISNATRGRPTTAAAT